MFKKFLVTLLLFFTLNVGMVSASVLEDSEVVSGRQSFESALTVYEKNLLSKYKVVVTPDELFKPLGMDKDTRVIGRNHIEEKKIEVTSKDITVSGLEQVLFHEFGHSLDTHLVVRQYTVQPAGQEETLVTTKFMGVGKYSDTEEFKALLEVCKRTFSKRATASNFDESPSESFAEIYSIYKTDPDARRYAPEMYEYLDKIVNQQV